MKPNIRNELKAQISHDEGRIPYAYQDSLGYWTCGVGFLIDHRKGAEIPNQVIDYWLDYNITGLMIDLNVQIPWWTGLDDVRQMVLVNMAYNMGVDGLMEFKKMLAALRAGNDNTAADEMLNSTWAGQVGDRATRLANMMRTGELP